MGHTRTLLLIEHAHTTTRAHEHGNRRVHSPPGRRKRRRRRRRFATLQRNQVEHSKHLSRKLERGEKKSLKISNDIEFNSFSNNSTDEAN
jgi:hypothetical protein